MFTQFKAQKTLFSTYRTLLLLLYAPPFWNVSIFTKLILLKKCGVLWLASYPVHYNWIIIGWIPQACDGNVTPLIILGNTQQYYSENKSYVFLCGNIWVALQLQKTHANRKSTSKSRKHFQHFDSRWCKCSQHNQIQFICSAFLFWLCCEHLQRVRCKIEEVVFLICRCFFYLKRVELSRPPQKLHHMTHLMGPCWIKVLIYLKTHTDPKLLNSSCINIILTRVVQCKLNQRSHCKCWLLSVSVLSLF